MKNFNKLVRDKIPEIIRENGETPKVRILDDVEYERELNKKLQEEVNEYLKRLSKYAKVSIIEVEE